MNKIRKFDAIVTSDDNRRHNANFSLIGDTNMFICRMDNRVTKLMPSKELLFLLGDKKLEFPTSGEKQKFVSTMDTAISSSLWLTKTKERVLLVGGILIGSAGAIFAMTKVLTVLMKSQNK